MSNLCKKTTAIYENYVNFINKYLSSILLLSIRIIVGFVFLRSGLVKFSNVDAAILLFEYEYQVPLLNPTFAAYVSMIFEIGCGALIIGGLFTRIAALPLIIMSIVIQLFVEQNPEHITWIIMLSTLAIYSGGVLSIDYFANKFGNKFCKK